MSDDRLDEIAETFSFAPLNDNECRWLLEEVKRLRVSLTDHDVETLQGIVRTRDVEIERLRTALKEIADGVHPLEMVRVAQAAVASQPHGLP